MHPLLPVERFETRTAPGDMQRIVSSHRHDDHFGGLVRFHVKVTARVGIHPLDRRVPSSRRRDFLLDERARLDGLELIHDAGTASRSGLHPRG